ncbi:MAG: hypothetical protein AAFY88_31040, partial [Acidobacteriota bacterium]
ANLQAATAAAALMGTAAALLSGRAFSLPPAARVYGALAALTVLGLAAAALEPGVCYPFVIGALAGALVAWRSPTLGATFAGAALALTLIPLIRMVPLGIGPMGLIASGLLAGLVVAPLVALLPDSPRLLPFGVAALAATVIAGVLPSIDDSNPRPLSLRARVEVDPDTGARSSRLLFLTSSGVPAPMEDAAGPVTSDAIGGYPLLATDMPDPGGEPVEIEVLGRTAESMTLHLRSPQTSWSLVLNAPEGTRITEVAWPGLTPVQGEGSGFLRLQAVDPEGVTVQLEGDLEGRLQLIDRTPGLPPQGQKVAAARPTWVSPIGSGDLTDIVAHVELADLRPAAEGDGEGEGDSDAGGEE